MNNVFKLKRKMHRLVNILFYCFFFAAGFLLGGGTFEKVINIFNNFI